MSSQAGPSAQERPAGTPLGSTLQEKPGPSSAGPGDLLVVGGISWLTSAPSLCHGLGVFPTLIASVTSFSTSVTTTSFQAPCPFEKQEKLKLRLNASPGVLLNVVALGRTLSSTLQPTSPA